MSKGNTKRGTWHSLLALYSGLLLNLHFIGSFWVSKCHIHLLLIFFWFLGYGFFFYHNYSVIAKLRGKLTIERSMIILVSAAVGLTLGYILNLTFGVAELLGSTTASLSFGVSVFYPIIDGIILIPAIIIFWSLRKGDSSHMHWLLMSASFVMVTIGDI